MGGLKLKTYWNNTLYTDYYKNIDTLKCAKVILNEIRTKKKVMFVCIGTDRATGDCYGPLLGTTLKKLNYIVEGTIENPIHALNCNERLTQIEDFYKDYFIISIDSCIANNVNDIGNMYIQRSPITPALGVMQEQDTKLKSVGDISIKVQTAISNTTDDYGIYVVRLHEIIKYVKKTQEIIEYLNLLENTIVFKTPK